MSHSDKRDFNEAIDSDEELTPKKRKIRPQSESSDLYLDTVSIFLQCSVNVPETTNPYASFTRHRSIDTCWILILKKSVQSVYQT